MINTNSSLLSALAGLRDVQMHVQETLRRIDPNTTDPAGVKARHEARQIQSEASTKVADVSSAIRKSAIDLTA